MEENYVRITLKGKRAEESFLVVPFGQFYFFSLNPS